jgi:hypothetical protein
MYRGISMTYVSASLSSPRFVQGKKAPSDEGRGHVGAGRQRFSRTTNHALRLRVAVPSGHSHFAHPTHAEVRFLRLGVSTKCLGALPFSLCGAPWGTPSATLGPNERHHVSRFRPRGYRSAGGGAESGVARTFAPSS